MADTGKVSDQFKGIKNAFEIQSHVLMNKLIEGLKDKVESIDPDLILSPVNKKMDKDNISLSLRGEARCDSEEEAKDKQDKVMNAIKSIQNASDVETIIKDK